MRGRASKNVITAISCLQCNRSKWEWVKGGTCIYITHRLARAHTHTYGERERKRMKEWVKWEAAGMNKKITYTIIKKKRFHVLRIYGMSMYRNDYQQQPSSNSCYGCSISLPKNHVTEGRNSSLLFSRIGLNSAAILAWCGASWFTPPKKVKKKSQEQDLE